MHTFRQVSQFEAWVSEPLGSKEAEGSNRNNKSLAHTTHSISFRVFKVITLCAFSWSCVYSPKNVCTLCKVCMRLFQFYLIHVTIFSISRSAVLKCPLCTAWVFSNFLGPQIHCLRFSPIVFSLGVFSHHLIIQFHICCKQEITLISDFLPQITLKRFLKLPGLKSLHYSRPWPLTVLLVSERRAPCASKPLGPGHPTALHSGPAESSTRRSPTPRRALVSS